MTPGGWISVLLSLAVYLLHIAVLPLLFTGVVRKGKALLQGRQGPSVLQPFRDTAKLFRKDETVSVTATWVFRWAPLLGAATVLAAALMAPWLGLPAPIPGDFLLFVYVLALGKFGAGLGALDTGSSFGGFAASREAAVSLQTEAAMISGLAALAVQAHSSSFAAMLAPRHSGLHMAVLALVAAAALSIAALVELSRMPADDPTTHLELTMIHEALILENSGTGLALAEYAAAIKTVLLIGLIGQVLLMVAPPMAPILTYVCSVALIFGGALVLIVAETVLVKLRWRRIPNLLSFAVAAGVLACLLVAIRG